MMVLGLDLSLTHTGWCLLKECKDNLKLGRDSIVIQEESKMYLQIESGVIETNNSDNHIERIIKIEQKVKLLTRGVDLVVIENYAYSRQYNREVLAELQGVIKRCLYINQIPFIIVPTQYIKKILTGNGKLSGKQIKEIIKKETEKKYGICFNTDHECEAFGLALIGINYLNMLNGNCYKTSLHEELTTILWNFNREKYITQFPWDITIEKNKKGFSFYNTNFNKIFTGNTIQECYDKFYNYVRTKAKKKPKIKRGVIKYRIKKIRKTEIN